MPLACFWVISTYQTLIGIVIVQRLMISCIIVYLTVSLISASPSLYWSPPDPILMAYQNILDIILCNDPLTIAIKSVTEPIGTSEHSIVNFSAFIPHSDNSHATLSENVIHNSNQPFPSIPMLPVFNWSAGDFEAINHELNSIDWHLLFGFRFTADALWNQFKTIIFPIIEMHAPKKSVPHYTKYKPRQYPKLIRTLLSRQAAIWRKLKAVKTLELKQR